MSNEIISNDLFSEVSAEQQEMVTGGFAFADSFTSFFKDSKAVQTFSASGPNGTVAGSNAMSELISTFGRNFVELR
ncbi:MAG: hypothetical protein HC908_04315 [Calothrix sp. SM1_7_51]|nr:hypothetical protein [Calothrix sp. SM1_7_51]